MPVPRVFLRRLLAIVLGAAAAANQARAAELVVDAPPALAAAAGRIRAVNLARLEADLVRAGLALPPVITVTLVPEDDPRVQAVPRWIVGLAIGERDVVILPQRVLAYPYDSMESVVRHEVAHLALNARAEGRPLPRWFHEGVAMSVDAGWGMSGRVRLFVEMARNPGTEDLGRLFASASEPDTSVAYGLSAALVADLRRRHGPAVPGAIAARVAAGADFARAFVSETGEPPDEAASRAWRVYRRWTSWMVAIGSDSAIWAGILLLSCAAFVAVRRRRAARRRQWDEDNLQEDA